MSYLLRKIAAIGFAMALAYGGLGHTAEAAESGVKAGVLKCQVESGWGFVFGSTRDVQCLYTPEGGARADRYNGTIKDYGINIGYLESGVMIWIVVAPTNDVGPGALAGSYGGVSADVAVALGIGAKILVGGFEDSIALQPLSIQGNVGLNIALGIAGLELHAIN